MRPESFVLSLETKQRYLAHRSCHRSADSTSFSDRPKTVSPSIALCVPMYPRVNPDALPDPGNLEMGHAVPYPPPLPPEEVLPVTVTQQRHGWRAPDRDSCEEHDPSTLLVAATLITMLAFLLGSSVPGGYWPQDTPSGDGNGRLYRAGDPIMRDLHRPRYWVFRAASWAGVASSMVLTLSLLVRMPVASRHVRWSFAAAYASLLLTFAASQTRTHLSLDIILWLAVLLVSWLITSVREEHRACIMKALCCSSRDN